MSLPPAEGPQGAPGVDALVRENAALRQEVRELRAFVRRVQTLEAIKLQLSKFVTPSVLKSVEQSPRAPRWRKVKKDVTVLFMDIVECTRLCEVLPPERMVFLLDNYFATLIDSIVEHGGEVNETMGDGLMVLFQDEDPCRHACGAAAAALLIAQRATEFNVCYRDVCEPLRVHIGINSGLAMVGVSEYSGTSGTRSTYGAMGMTTNLAARVAASARAGEILLGPATNRRIRGAFRTSPQGARKFKNVSEPVEVFRLLDGGIQPALARGLNPLRSDL